ncbi:ATP-binding protein [Aliiglaciecola sp. CAU 1673]|uniref:sensor histidine kinase n=1 Tax=Aliiglaciecola sp. CAU 1673 TaxID=3032595 RepID=UPI0023DCCF4A|nr:ATP-binding protein [Aliiglaciecola sp. CAU 1673]MDF2177266.1 ATP-binding protein [Aliiglaciecola sp. CAU 1673]
MSSIRRYLVLLLLSVITLVIFVAAIQGYRSSMDKATRLFDVQLSSLADSLNAMYANHPSSEVSLGGDLAVQIWQNDRLLLRSANAPVLPMSSMVNGYGEENFNGLRWRTLARSYAAEGRLLLVAQPLSLRFELAEELIVVAMQPLVLSLPLLALLISLAVKQGLHPLVDLSDALKRKKADDMYPITLERTPAELNPVVDTINRLLARLEGAMARERRFASDAAHELRTPLSVLKINTHNLALEVGEDSANMQLLKEGVERMSHVVDQILLLNRTNPEHFQRQSKPVDLYKVCQATIASLYPQIADKRQQIGLDGTSAILLGDEFSLTVLLQNLISNASKYSPEGSSIDVQVSKGNDNIVLAVADSGPGLPESEYERVFERFYRVGADRHQSGVSGCGLGLAIVKHIVELYGAAITLGRSASLGGLAVNITFPLKGKIHG